MQFSNWADNEQWFDVLNNARPTVPPATQVVADAWDAKNRTCKLMLTRTISSSLLLQFEAATLAKQIWDQLQRTYGHMDDASKITALQSLTCVNMEPGEDIPQYFQRVKIISSHAQQAGYQVPESQICNCLLKGIHDPVLRSARDSILRGGIPLTLDYVQDALLDTLRTFRRDCLDQYGCYYPSQINPFSNFNPSLSPGQAPVNSNFHDSMPMYDSSGASHQGYGPQNSNQFFQPNQLSYSPQLFPRIPMHQNQQQFNTPYFNQGPNYTFPSQFANAPPISIPQSGRTRPTVCYHCKSDRHDFRSCDQIDPSNFPKGPRCGACFGYGHLQGACANNRPQTQSSQGVQRPPRPSGANDPSNRGPRSNIRQQPSANLVCEDSQQFSTPDNTYVAFLSQHHQAYALNNPGFNPHNHELSYENVTDVNNNSFLPNSSGIVNDGKPLVTFCHDSAATLVIVKRCDKAIDRSKCPRVNILLASNGACVFGILIGDVRVKGFNLNGKQFAHSVILQNVVEVPNASKNLLSGSRLLYSGLNSNLSTRGVYVREDYKPRRLSMFGKLCCDMFHVTLEMDWSYDKYGATIQREIDTNIRQGNVNIAYGFPEFETPGISQPSSLECHGTVTHETFPKSNFTENVSTEVFHNFPTLLVNITPVEMGTQTEDLMINISEPFSLNSFEDRGVQVDFSSEGGIITNHVNLPLIYSVMKLKNLT